jgi:hypothetical protein
MEVVFVDRHSPKSWAELRLRSNQMRFWLVGLIETEYSKVVN